MSSDIYTKADSLRTELRNRKAALMIYLGMKVRQSDPSSTSYADEDFHGIADAANDLREVNAQLGVLDHLLDPVP